MMFLTINREHNGASSKSAKIYSIFEKDFDIFDNPKELIISVNPLSDGYYFN